MKRTFTLLFASLLVFSCSENKEASIAQENKSVSCFGDSISSENSIPSEKLLGMLNGKDSIATKLEGKILDVCQKKGCWMELDLGSGKSIRVTFKDYAFFVPKDAAGKYAIIDGYAKVDTISVNQLREYAGDAGKTKQEIDNINQPEVELSFEAKGVIIKN